MHKENLSLDVTKINCILELDKRVVGVRFIFNERDFEMADAKEIEKKIAYCVMVKSAMNGHGIKVKGYNFGCIGGARALGAIDIEESYRSGQGPLALGLYQDLTIAKDVSNKMTFCQHKLYGVVIKPLEEFNEKPDVVLIITNPYNSMRIIQGYTYIFGMNTTYKLSGNQAVCSECTAYPFESNTINISMLCGGTRYKCKWGENEVGIGMPFNKFSAIVDGIYRTTNAMEPNGKKLIIEEKLKKNGINNMKIEKDAAYYLLSMKK